HSNATTWPAASASDRRASVCCVGVPSDGGQRNRLMTSATSTPVPIDGVHLFRAMTSTSRTRLLRAWTGVNEPVGSSSNRHRLPPFQQGVQSMPQERLRILGGLRTRL